MNDVQSNLAIKVALVAVAASIAAGCAVVTSQSEPEPTESAAQALVEGAVTLLSRDKTGHEGNHDSTTPQISGNGRYVVFASTATNWSSIDTNGTSDIYRKDRSTGSIALISTSSGVVGNAGSYDPSVSDSGKVVFASNASNLVSGTTGTAAIVVSSGGVSTRADVGASGAANGPSARPRISGDGNFVVFQSDASNLVSGDTNGATDIFVRDLRSSAITRVSVAGGGAQANGRSYDASISYDGRYVAFTSDATNIQYNDGNGVSDVFVYDRVNATASPVSFSTTGMGGAVGEGASDEAQISGDGRHVVFRSFSRWDSFDASGGIRKTFVKDLNVLGGPNAPHCVSLSTSGVLGNGASWQSAISFDGSVVAFASSATNLVAGDTNGDVDVFVRDRAAGRTVRADASGTTQANGSVQTGSTLSFAGTSSAPATSLLVFDSRATNLVSGDTNASADVFSAAITPDPAGSCSSTSAPLPTSDPGNRVVISATQRADSQVVIPAPTADWQLQYEYSVPPLPCAPTWNLNGSTFYVWGDVDFDTYGSSGAYPLSSYQFNQIVPQLMIGTALSGNDASYAPSWQLFDHWVIQAQYFWMNADGNFYAQTGPVVSVKPGDRISTVIHYSAATGGIDVSIASEEGGSYITIPQPFPNEATAFASWKDFFQRAAAQSGQILGRPQLNVETHFIDTPTLCSALPWTVEQIAFPNVPATASSFVTSTYGDFACGSALTNLDF
ncbi:MAG TPA: hypothetical protein VGI39_27875 [Polyangiaceae bacterium]|jgi:hypothetical protein